MRESAVAVLAAFLLMAAGLIGSGAVAARAARATLARWDAARAALPGVGCGVCGAPARYDVSRLVRKQGEVVGRVPLGLRCDQHREAESAKAESGLYTAWMLCLLGVIALAIGAGTSVAPIANGSAHPLWAGPRVRPVRRAAIGLAVTIWVSVFGYIVVVSFKDAYATLPLWSAMGGMLCVWLADLLSGGEYVRCARCSWHGNLMDLRHTDGTCPRCEGTHFRVQELLRAIRAGIKTTYHFRMMVGLTMAQLDELERDGRIWKEPRGSWAPPKTQISMAA